MKLAPFYKFNYLTKKYLIKKIFQGYKRKTWVPILHVNLGEQVNFVAKLTFPLESTYNFVY